MQNFTERTDHSDYFSFKDFKNYRSDNDSAEAFTEDGFPVHKIVIHMLYEDLLEMQQFVRFHFQRWYGPVISVELEHERYCGLFGFITFEKAKHAKEAVSPNKLLKHLHKTARVNAADTWQQPNSAEFVRNRLETYTGPIDLDQSPICGLNHDCLMHLYSFLDFGEQFRLSRLCERFEEVFEMNFQREHRHLGTKHAKVVTLMEWRHILKHYGHLVESAELILVENSKKRFKEYLPIYCPNLKSIRIVNDDRCSRYFDDNIVNNLKNIEKITLSNCGHIITDLRLGHLSRIKSLQFLDISSSERYFGGYLDAFENLKELHVGACNFYDEHFIKMCEKVGSQLTALNIAHCRCITNKSIQKLIEHGSNIRELSVSTSTPSCNIDPVATLPNLEKLFVFASSECAYPYEVISDKFFIDLVSNVKDKLKVLKVLEFCRLDLSDTQKKCICDLTALEELHLTQGPYMDDAFMADMLRLTNLKYLKLECAQNIGTCVSQEGWAEFISKSPKLKGLIVPRYFRKELDNITFIIEGLIQSKSGTEPPLVMAINAKELRFPSTFEKYVHMNRNYLTIKALPVPEYTKPSKFYLCGDTYC